MYVLVEFPEVQKFQEKTGFSNYSEGYADVDGAYYVDFAWLFNIDRGYAIEALSNTVDEIGFSDVEKDYVDKQWSKSMPFDGGMSSTEALIHILNNYNK